MRVNFSKTLQTGLLIGSLVWSADCSSAPVPVPRRPGDSSTASSTSTSELPCKDIEAPTLIRRVVPDYPAYLRRQGIEGEVVAQGVLNPDATFEDIKIVSSPSEALSELAVKAFRKWRYKAAFCRDWGKPIRVYITMTLTFALHAKP